MRHIGIKNRAKLPRQRFKVDVMPECLADFRGLAVEMQITQGALFERLMSEYLATRQLAAPSEWDAMKAEK